LTKQKLITIAEFSNAHEVKLSLLKDMQEQAGIDYLVKNEYTRIVKSSIFAPPNESIEVKVYKENLEKAIDILNSIN